MSLRRFVKSIVSVSSSCQIPIHTESMAQQYNFSGSGWKFTPFPYSTLLICHYEGHHYDDGILTPTSLKCSKDMLTCQMEDDFPLLSELYKCHKIDFYILLYVFDHHVLTSFISHYNNVQKITCESSLLRFKERL